MRSTSIHTLNADKGLSLWQKPLYLFLNFLNNLLPYVNVDKRIKFKMFEPKNLREVWDQTYPDSSAARKLSDIYWRTLPWREIKEKIGGEINIFDTGCGHGNYAVRIQEGSGGQVTRYTGVDAKRRPNWDELEKNYSSFHFIESRSNDIFSLIPENTNIFISQSAIEHFDEDLLYFERVREFVEKSNRPITQIHLFPGSATLPLYLFHGLRQYTPRTISKITRLFKDAEISLTPLGGEMSKKLHFKYFTWPVLITRKFGKPTFDVSEYDKKLRIAVEKDLDSDISSPLFWALQIFTKP